MLKWLALKGIAEPLGVLRRYRREGIDSQMKIRMSLTDAGLDDGECFVSEYYGEGEILSVERAGHTFDAMVREKKVRGWHDELKKPGAMERARELFCREIEKTAQGEGQVRSWLRFYMAAGRKMEQVIFLGQPPGTWRTERHKNLRFEEWEEDRSGRDLGK